MPYNTLYMVFVVSYYQGLEANTLQHVMKWLLYDLTSGNLPPYVVLYAYDT